MEVRQWRLWRYEATRRADRADASGSEREGGIARDVAV